MKLTKIFLSALLLTSSVATFAEDIPTVELNFQERYVPVQNSKLYCKSFGKGDPILVIHGGPGLSQDYLLPQLADLAKRNQVIFYDQRGCGKSEGAVDAESIKIDFYVDDIDAIRKAYGFEKITLLGHSWGGHLAMKYAISHPESLDKLILMNSMAASAADVALFIKSWVSKMSSVLPVLNKMKESEAFLAGDPDTMARYFKIMYGPFCYSPTDVEKLNLRMLHSASINGNKSYEILKETYLTKSFDLTSALKDLKCKTLIIHGDSDIIPLQGAKNIHAAIPKSKLVVLEKCGHFPYVESPDVTFSCLDGFLHQP